MWLPSIRTDTRTGAAIDDARVWRTSGQPGVRVVTVEPAESGAGRYRAARMRRDVLDRNAERQSDLLRDPWATAGRVAPSHVDDRHDDVLGGSFRAGLLRHIR